MTPAILSGALVVFVNAIALFGSQAIVGLPGRVFTLPTRIYALFDYPPQYGLASALSLIFVALTVAALYLQRRYLARRSYVTLVGKGSRPQLVDLGPARWGVFAFCVGVFTVAAPYLTLLAVSVSKSWGLYETGALGPVAALAIVTMLIITTAIVLASKRARAARRSRRRSLARRGRRGQ